jgi:His-Xaa-Ser system protein HxsD
MPQEVSLDFDKQLYSVEAIQKAAYRLMNFFTVNLSLSDSKIFCKVTPNINTNQDSFSLALEEFRKHIIDYQLRYQLKSETEALRNLVLAVAFSNTGLLKSE